MHGVLRSKIWSSITTGRFAIIDRMNKPEIIEPDQKLDQDERETLRKAAELLAKLLDTAIRIPGTNIYIGLDPLLGLLPGVGDAIASLIGSVVLVLAARLGIPKITFIRMNLNLLINGTVGAIPIIGDAFSVWFKSNTRNAILLARVVSYPSPAARVSDWVFVVGLLTATLTLLFAAIAGMLWLALQLWQFIQ